MNVTDPLFRKCEQAATTLLKRCAPLRMDPFQMSEIKPPFPVPCSLDVSQAVSA